MSKFEVVSKIRPEYLCTKTKDELIWLIFEKIKSEENLETELKAKDSKVSEALKLIDYIHRIANHTIVPFLDDTDRLHDICDRTREFLDDNAALPQETVEPKGTENT